MKQGEKKTHRVKVFGILYKVCFLCFKKFISEDYTSNLEAPTPMSTT